MTLKPCGRITIDALRAALKRGEFEVERSRQLSQRIVKLYTTGPVDFTISEKTYNQLIKTGELK